AAEEGSQEGWQVFIPWLDVICQRTASASWGGSWSERLEAYWYTEGSAGALGPGRTGQAGEGSPAPPPNPGLPPFGGGSPPSQGGSAAPNGASPPFGANGPPFEAD